MVIIWVKKMMIAHFVNFGISHNIPITHSTIPSRIRKYRIPIKCPSPILGRPGTARVVPVVAANRSDIGGEKSDFQRPYEGR